MKVIIVGASGYIGAPLFKLFKRGYETHGTATVGSSAHIPLRLEFAGKFDYDLIQESDVVLVAAAISAPDVCARDQAYARSVNVTGTALFISEALKKKARIIFFSSDAVYGEQINEFDENTSCDPRGAYAVMKHEVENLFLGNPGFKTIRMSYVFSSEDNFTKYLLKCAETGQEAEVFHPFYRAVIHRNEVLLGTMALVQNWYNFPHSAVNFGGAQVIARTEFAQELKDALLPTLRFKCTAPASGFFNNRPRRIQMRSMLLASLLGRPVRSMYEAIQDEFLKHVGGPSA